MSPGLQKIVDVFKFHKKKIFLFLAAIVVFLVLLFPYDDLGDIVTQKVSELTQKQVYLQFDEMGFSLYPQPGIRLEKVYVESAFAPTLKLGALAIAPSLRSLLSFKPGVSVYAEDFLGGNIQASTRGGEESSKGTLRQIVNINLDKPQLGEILKLAAAPIKLNGDLNGDIQLDIDPDFADQPSGEINAQIDRFELPSSSIPTPIGPLSLPGLKISSIQLAARITKGEIFIDRLILGNSRDELNGQIKGRIRVNFRKRGVQLTAQCRDYELTVNLKTLPSLQKKAGLFLTFIDSYKKPGIGSTAYDMKITGSNCNLPPRIQAL